MDPLQLLPPGIGFTAPVAVTTVSATIACGFMLARFAGTRAREAAREREHEFETRLAEFLAGTLRGRDLLRVAARLEPDLFWGAVGGLRAHLARRAGNDLEQTLGRSRHVRAERNALRDGSPVRRELAARRLAWVGAARYRQALHRALRTGPEPVSVAAAVALARVRDGAALDWVLEHPAAFAHRTPRTRLALLRAFSPGAAPRLRAALARGVGEPRMERAVIDALGIARCQDAAPLIAARLAHEWRDVRVAAARALGKMRAVEQRVALSPLLRDPDWRVRAQTARALGRLAALEQITALREALRDANWWVRHHAAYALASLGDEGTRVLREVAAGDADPFARDIASEALAGGFPGPRT
ncbi:MAG: HEAT repeat domain-containing protein [Candidatus Eisenbacteria bacterium]